MCYFHCTHRKLNDGDLIAPGNWGKIIFDIGVNHSSWKREMALEAVRAWNFPDKPSRLKSTFACETIEAIRFYRTHLCPNGYIYEVEPFNDMKMHRGDFNAVEPLPNTNYNMWQVANMYWRHELKTSVEGYTGVECIELIFESSLRVIRNIPG